MHNGKEFQLNTIRFSPIKQDRYLLLKSEKMLTNSVHTERNKQFLNLISSSENQINNILLDLVYEAPSFILENVFNMTFGSLDIYSYEVKLILLYLR